MSEATAMMVDTPLSPTDMSYLESIDEEPWKSACSKALMAARGDESSPPSNASSRLDQLELDIRSDFLKLFFETDASQLVDKAGAFWTTTLQICLHMIHASTTSKDPRYEKMAPRKLPVLLIEDCLDAMSVEDVKKFWEKYVEPSFDDPQQFFGDLLWNSSNVCHLPFLRVCNQFLRVLDTVAHGDQGEWKGRILTALAKGFSIADRSALKFWGTFHGSATDYETEETFQKTHSSTTPSKTASEMNYSLYESFWSLQADFSNPNRIHVASFIKKLRVVMAAMDSAASRNPKSQSSESSIPACTSIRYMTSSSLLPTQLATPAFRASVLSQFLITASHLSSESPSLANALAPLLTLAKKLLQADAPELYHLLWESILAHREDAWRKWKKDKCPVSAFDPKPKPEATATPVPQSRLLLAGALVADADKPTAGDEYKSLPMDELMQVSKELKKTVPSLEEHLETYVEALDPDSGIEAEYHPGNDPLFAWRAMRLYAKHQLPLLKHCRRPADLERITREWYHQQGKDIPGEMPPVPSDDDLDEEEEETEEHDDKGSEGPDEDHRRSDDESKDDDEEDRASDKYQTEDTTSRTGDVEMNDTADDKVAESMDDDEKSDGRSTSDGGDKEDDDKEDETQIKLEEGGNEKMDEADHAHVDDPPKEDGVDAETTKETPEDDKGHHPDTDKEAGVKSEAAEQETEPFDTDKQNGDKDDDVGESAADEVDAESSKDAGRGGNDVDVKKGEEQGSRSRDRKRKRSRSEDRDKVKTPRGSSSFGDGGRDRPRSGGGSGNRGGGRRDDGPPRGGPRGRRDDGPVTPRVGGAGRRDEGPPGRGGRGGPPPRRDDVPPNRGGGGRHDDVPPQQRLGGRNEGAPPAPTPRLHEDGPPRGGGGGGGGGGRGGDRRDERNRGGGGGGGDSRRRGRDDSRFRGRR